MQTQPLGMYIEVLAIELDPPFGLTGAVAPIAGGLAVEMDSVSESRGALASVACGPASETRALTNETLSPAIETLSLAIQMRPLAGSVPGGLSEMRRVPRGPV